MNTITGLSLFQAKVVRFNYPSSFHTSNISQAKSAPSTLSPDLGLLLFQRFRNENFLEQVFLFCVCVCLLSLSLSASKSTTIRMWIWSKWVILSNSNTKLWIAEFFLSSCVQTFLNYFCSGKGCEADPRKIQSWIPICSLLIFSSFFPSLGGRIKLLDTSGLKAPLFVTAPSTSFWSKPDPKVVGDQPL